MPPEYPTFSDVRQALSRGQCDRLAAWAHEHQAAMAEDAPAQWEPERLSRLRRRKVEMVREMDSLNERRDTLSRSIDEVSRAITEEEQRL